MGNPEQQVLIPVVPVPVHQGAAPVRNPIVTGQDRVLGNIEEPDVSRSGVTTVNAPVIHQGATPVRNPIVTGQDRVLGNIVDPEVERLGPIFANPPIIHQGTAPVRNPVLTSQDRVTFESPPIAEFVKIWSNEQNRLILVPRASVPRGVPFITADIGTCDGEQTIIYLTTEASEENPVVNDGYGRCLKKQEIEDIMSDNYPWDPKLHPVTRQPWSAAIIKLFDIVTKNNVSSERFSTFLRRSRIRPQPGQLPPILRPAPPTLIPPAPPQPRPQPRPQPQAPQPPTRNAAGYLFSEGLTGRDLDSPFGRGTERGIDQLQMNVLVMYNRWENYILHVMAQYPRVDYATRNGPVYLRNLQTWQTQFNEQLETLRALHPASMTVRTFRDNTFRTIVEHFTVKVRRTQLELEEWSGVVVDQARRMGLRPENVSFDII